MQKSQNILIYEGIGEVSFVRNRRAKNLSIRINQRGEIRVTIPRLVSRREAERFFLSRKQWVAKQLETLQQRDCRGSLPGAGETIRVRGKDLRVTPREGEEETEEAIWRLLQGEAADYLPSRVKELADFHGFRVSGVRVRRMRTRWGSCTARNSINLNSWLVVLPEYLSDYVILHELVHTRIPNHSSKFWEELDVLTGGQSRKYRKELRSHQIMCFPGNPEGQ